MNKRRMNIFLFKMLEFHITNGVFFNDSCINLKHSQAYLFLNPQKWQGVEKKPGTLIVGIKRVFFFSIWYNFHFPNNITSNT